MNEKEFLQSYDLTAYKRPSVAADMTVFSVIDTPEDNYRKLPEKRFCILLIQRGEHPYKDQWALPGGFVREDESVENAARRELKEETGIEKADLRQFHVFSQVGRDPRGWIISCAFMALIEKSNIALQSTHDAKAARWFALNYKLLKEEKQSGPTQHSKTAVYALELSAEKETLSALIEVYTTASEYSKETHYKILQNNGLAFDHALIIARAISQIRSEIENSSMAFRFVPEQFTLTSLQQVYEAILDKKLLTPNFRRKIAPYVLESEQSVSPAGHRPAKLYTRNHKTFAELV